MKRTIASPIAKTVRCTHPTRLTEAARHAAQTKIPLLIYDAQCLSERQRETYHFLGEGYVTLMFDD